MASLPPVIAKALAINPEAGSTYLDAEHVVLLMQENRSFDHAFGTLRGVRGFNDPRAMWLANGNRVWLQTDAKGDTYSPFRLNIKDTKITWMGSLPHSRESQVGARNNGMHDNWIEAKKSGDSQYADMPLTMGYYTRDDIPFYYALADAFTICDQHFCASLTPTDPNRLYFWSGTVRGEMDEDSRAYIDNDDIEKGVEWRTFPELLEMNQISWKIYQNELNVEGGFTGEEDAWLSNFGDNTLEFFNQYNVKLSERHIHYLPEKKAKLEAEINSLQTKVNNLPKEGKEWKEKMQELDNLKAALNQTEEDINRYTPEKFEQLTSFQKSIHKKAFEVNSGDPFQHTLSPLDYSDGTVERELMIPKGDVLHQFRKDVQNNTLPTVSWLVAPETFSDHPSAPWFGAWYLSEVMDILTENPEVWKKTIFILTYDENDGYFDHSPPFTPPDSRDPKSGKVSSGIDTRVDYVKLKEDYPGPIGLGYRVPLIIASPWSRGGLVNSQVFDHTSCIQFLEHFLNEKYGKQIRETNITPWRRTVCGNLTSVFRKYEGIKPEVLPFIEKDPFFEEIHKAKFRDAPSDFKSLSNNEINQLNHHPQSSPLMPVQEKGTRRACAIPYEIYADGNFDSLNQRFEISMGSDSNLFKAQSSGSPFIVHAMQSPTGKFSVRNYAVKPGDQLGDHWPVQDFDGGSYLFRLLGPNGFYREFSGNQKDPALQVWVSHSASGTVSVKISNKSKETQMVTIRDEAYGQGAVNKTIQPGATAIIQPFDLSKSYGWYHFSITIPGNTRFEKKYAGHTETGRTSMSDPAMA